MLCGTSWPSAGAPFLFLSLSLGSSSCGPPPWKGQRDERPTTTKKLTDKSQPSCVFFCRKTGFLLKNERAASSGTGWKRKQKSVASPANSPRFFCSVHSVPTTRTRNRRGNPSTRATSEDIDSRVDWQSKRNRTRDQVVRSSRLRERTQHNNNKKREKEETSKLFDGRRLEGTNRKSASQNCEDGAVPLALGVGRSGGRRVALGAGVRPQQRRRSAPRRFQQPQQQQQQSQQQQQQSQQQQQQQRWQQRIPADVRGAAEPAGSVLRGDAAGPGQRRRRRGVDGVGVGHSDAAATLRARLRQRRLRQRSDGHVDAAPRRRRQASPPGVLPDRPAQRQQLDVLAVGAGGDAGVARLVGDVGTGLADRQRDAVAVARQKVRTDVPESSVLRPQTRQSGHLQEHGLWQDVATVPVLLVAVSQTLRTPQSRHHHQGQRTGGPLHRRPLHPRSPLR